jgi:hypothetical protein
MKRLGETAVIAPAAMQLAQYLQRNQWRSARGEQVLRRIAPSCEGHVG